MSETLERYFLFTVQCAVLEVATSCLTVFGQGDGLFSVEGETHELDSGALNAPEYPAYWVNRSQALQGTRYFEGTARECALATDGLLGRAPQLRVFSDDGRTWQNPVHLQRRLNVYAAEQKLSDDCTVVLLRARPQVLS